MKIVFTKNDLPLSKLIRWGLKEPVSHVGLVYGNIIFHINLLGAHIEYLPTFEKHNEIVFSIDTNMPTHIAKVVFWHIVGAHDGLAYDFSGLLYFIWRGFLWRFFGLPFPEKNALDNPGAALCVKIVEYLPKEYYPRNPDIKDIEMVSAYKLFKALSETVMVLNKNAVVKL